MGTKTRKDGEYYPESITNMHMVEFDGNRIVFDTADEAASAYKLLQGARGLCYCYGISGVDYRIEKPAARIEMKLARILDRDPDELGDEGEYQHLECDHYIIKDSDVCGVSKCYDMHNLAVGDDIGALPRGWRVTFNDIVEENIVTCPKCMARIAEDIDADPDDLIDNPDTADDEINSAYDIEREVVERKKNAS